MGRGHFENISGALMDDSAKYRANAMACANFAERISDPRRRVLLLSMAEAWLRLADHAERRASRERASLRDKAPPIGPPPKPPEA
jgi:hypothetical protein